MEYHLLIDILLLIIEKEIFVFIIRAEYYVCIAELQLSLVLLV